MPDAQPRIASNTAAAGTSSRALSNDEERLVKASPTGHGLLATLLLLAFTGVASAKPIDCWVGVRNGLDFSGKQERIYGPMELPSMKNLGGFDWNGVIESLEVGPGAEVTLFRSENFVVPEGPRYHAL